MKFRRLLFNPNQGCQQNFGVGSAGMHLATLCPIALEFVLFPGLVDFSPKTFPGLVLIHDL